MEHGEITGLTHLEFSPEYYIRSKGQNLIRTLGSDSGI